jgi:hypothetical protein
MTAFFTIEAGDGKEKNGLLAQAPEHQRRNSEGRIGEQRIGGGLLAT